MSDFLNKLFRPDDFIGLLLVLLIAFVYLWQWAGRPSQNTKNTKAANDLKSPDVMAGSPAMPKTVIVPFSNLTTEQVEQLLAELHRSGFVMGTPEFAERCRQNTAASARANAIGQQ